jgi:hypothetical protein
VLKEEAVSVQERVSVTAVFTEFFEGVKPVLGPVFNLNAGMLAEVTGEHQHPSW